MGKRGPLAPGQERTKSNPAVINTSYFPADIGLSGEAGKIWITVVESMPEGYFKEADRPQLRGYCEAAARLARVSREINRKGFKEVYTDRKGVMRKNPWLDVYRENLALVNSTATKLRISKSAQISPKMAGRAASDAEEAAHMTKVGGIATLLMN